MASRNPARSAGGPSPLRIVLRPIATLKPAPRNPRRHSCAQVRRIAAFAFNVPIPIGAALKPIAADRADRADRAARTPRHPYAMAPDPASAALETAHAG